MSAIAILSIIVAVLLGAAPGLLYAMCGGDVDNCHDGDDWLFPWERDQ